jgi:DDE family transposase
MRPSHCTLRAAAVTPWLVALLTDRLALPDFRASVPGRLLARLLLLASALGRSLSGLCGKLHKAPAPETIRTALHVALPAALEGLRQRLTAGLHALVPSALRRTKVALAADLHLRPFYGDKATPGLYKGKRQAGTKRFFAYASLAVLDRGLRFTVGLVPVGNGQPLTEVLAALLGQAKAAGVRPRYLLLDRGFYAAEVVRWLQQARLAFLMPLIRRGKPAGPGQAATGTQPFFGAGCRPGWYAYGWVARPRQTDLQTGKKRKGPAVAVTVSVCVARSPAGKPWAFVANAVAWPPALVVQRYRRRFGIETSYRQLGQCLAQTTSTDRRVRLLLVGVALVVRNAWAWLHWEVLAERAGNRRRLRSPLLTLDDLKLWLVTMLGRALQLVLDIETDEPVPQELRA